MGQELPTPEGGNCVYLHEYIAVVIVQQRWREWVRQKEHSRVPESKMESNSAPEMAPLEPTAPLARSMQLRVGVGV